MSRKFVKHNIWQMLGINVHQFLTQFGIVKGKDFFSNPKTIFTSTANAYITLY